MLNVMTIKDFDIEGKRVINRVDFNVPVKDGKITDENRIVESLDTIKYILANGASELIILSHMGKIKNEEDKVKNDLRIVVPVLMKYLNIDVDFIEHTSGDELIDELKSSKARVKVIQNTRYEDLNGKRESENDEILGSFWASLGDIFVFDGWGVSHRNNASTSSMFKNSKCCVGFLVQKELNKINGFLENDSKPFTIIMGGAKVEDKIPVIKNLIDKCDKLIIGGAMAFTFLKAKGYNVGSSLVKDESIGFCKKVIAKYNEKIVLPIDFITNKRVCHINSFEEDEIGFDIGPKTIELFKNIIPETGKIFINGTMGKNEEDVYAKGTKKLFEHLGNLASKGVVVLVGGGDTASAALTYDLVNKVYYVSTGGGATLKYLGNELGDIFAFLEESVKKYGITRNKKISS